MPMTREQFESIYSQIPNQNLAFDVLQLPDSVASPAERTTAYNAIYNAQRANTIQQEIASGAPRRTFVDDADRYNYRTQLSQKVAMDRFATLQNPKDRYVAQLNMSPEIRRMVIEADPQRFAQYGNSLNTQNVEAIQGTSMVQQPMAPDIQPFDTLSASRTFRALPLERQEQIESMITANPLLRENQKIKGKMSDDYIEQRIKAGDIELYPVVDEKSGKTFSRAKVRRKIQVPDPMSPTGTSTKEEWVEPTTPEQELIKIAMIKGRIGLPSDGKVRPRAKLPQQSVTPSRDNYIRRSRQISPEEIGPYEEYEQSRMQPTPNPLEILGAIPAATIGGIYEGLGGYGSTPGATQRGIEQRLFPSLSPEDPQERAWFHFLKAKQSGMSHEEALNNTIRVLGVLPKPPKPQPTAPLPTAPPIMQELTNMNVPY